MTKTSSPIKLIGGTTDLQAFQREVNNRLSVIDKNFSDINKNGSGWWRQSGKGGENPYLTGGSWWAEGTKPMFTGYYNYYDISGDAETAWQTYYASVVDSFVIDCALGGTGSLALIADGAIEIDNTYGVGDLDILSNGVISISNGSGSAEDVYITSSNGIWLDGSSGLFVVTGTTSPDVIFAVYDDKLEFFNAAGVTQRSDPTAANVSHSTASFGDVNTALDDLGGIINDLRQILLDYGLTA